MSPDPLGIRYIVEAHIVFGIRHQSVTFGSFQCGFGGFVPLSGEQISTGQKSVYHIGVRFVFRLVIRTYITVKKSFGTVEVIDDLCIDLFERCLSFRFGIRIGRFGIQRYTKSILIFQIGELIMLCQMKITESTYGKCLSLGMPELRCIIVSGSLNRNGRITVVNGLIHQIPGESGTSVGRHHHVIELIRRIKPIHRARNHVVSHHVVQAHQSTIADVGISGTIFEQIVPRTVKDAFGIRRYRYEAGIYGICRLIVEEVAAATPQEQKEEEKEKGKLTFRDLISGGITHGSLSPTLCPKKRRRRDMSVIVKSYCSHIICYFILYYICYM